MESSLRFDDFLKCLLCVKKDFDAGKCIDFTTNSQGRVHVRLADLLRRNEDINDDDIAEWDKFIRSGNNDCKKLRHAIGYDYSNNPRGASREVYFNINDFDMSLFFAPDNDPRLSAMQVETEMEVPMPSAPSCSSGAAASSSGTILKRRRVTRLLEYSGQTEEKYIGDIVSRMEDLLTDKFGNTLKENP